MRAILQWIYQMLGTMVSMGDSAVTLKATMATQVQKLLQQARSATNAGWVSK
jgi:hypothetical protein